MTAILFGILWVGIEILLLNNTHTNTTPASNVLFLVVNILLTIGVPTLSLVTGVGSVVRYIWDVRLPRRQEPREEKIDLAKDIAPN